MASEDRQVAPRALAAAASLIAIVAGVLVLGRGAATRPVTHSAPPRDGTPQPLTSPSPSGQNVSTGARSPSGLPGGPIAEAVSLHGSVIADDGSPHSAVVVARGFANPWTDVVTTEAGADGVFAITLSQGTWWVHAESQGLLSSCYKIDVPSQKVIERLELSLFPARIVWGLVLDPSERPVAGAVVSYMAWNVEHVDEPVTLSTTTSEGEYRLLLPTMSGRVRAQAGGLAPAAHEFRERSAPEERYDFHLEQACRMAGRVLDRSVRPIGGAELQVQFKEYGRADPYPFMLAVRSDVDGRYDLPTLTSGWHEFTLKSEGFLSEEVHIELKGPIDHDFTMIRGGCVEGRLLGRTGDPVAGADVAVQLSEKRGAGAFIPDTWSGPDGRFRLEAVRPGTYFVRVLAKGFALTEGGDFQVIDEGRPGEMEIRLPEGATLRGTVRSATDGTPVASASVYRIAKDGEMVHTEPGVRYLDATSTDASGEFEIRHLPPGTLRIVVRDGRHRPATIDVTLNDGELRRQDVSLSEGGVVSGTVHLGRKDVSEYVDLFVQTLGMDYISFLRPNSEGSFEIAGLPTGPFVLRMQWHLGQWCDNAPAWVLEVEPGKPLDLDIPLAGACHLKGAVRRRGAAAHEGFRLDALESDVAQFYLVPLVDADGRYEVWSIQPGRYVVTTDREVAVERDAATGRCRLKRHTAGQVIEVPTSSREALIDIDLPEPR